jgi:tetratricopeptide (TPR) repeat protein
VVRRELELALADLDRAIQLEPRDAWTHYERGVMFEEMGDGQRAVASFTRAIEIDPTHFKSFQHRGWTQRMLGEHERAVEDLSRAIELTPVDDPDMPGLLYARSQSLLLLGRTHEAQRDEERLEAIRNNQQSR